MPVDLGELHSEHTRSARPFEGRPTLCSPVSSVFRLLISSGSPQFPKGSPQVKAVRVGTALIKATLDGRTAYACADVSKDAREFAERSDCNDFLPPRMSEEINEPLHMPPAAQSPATQPGSVDLRIPRQ